MSVTICCMWFSLPAVFLYLSSHCGYSINGSTWIVRPRSRSVLGTGKLKPLDRSASSFVWVLTRHGFLYDVASVGVTISLCDFVLSVYGCWDRQWMMPLFRIQSISLFSNFLYRWKLQSHQPCDLYVAACFRYLIHFFFSVWLLSLGVALLRLWMDDASVRNLIN